MFQSMSEIKSQKMNFENKCATVEMPHLLYLAPFWGRDPHGEEGGIDRSFDLQCQRLAEIMGLY